MFEELRRPLGRCAVEEILERLFVWRCTGFGCRDGDRYEVPDLPKYTASFSWREAVKVMRAFCAEAPCSRSAKRERRGASAVFIVGLVLYCEQMLRVVFERRGA